MIWLVQNPHWNLKKKIFIPNYTTPRVITGFEQLSSSTCCRLIWLAKRCPERAIYVFLEKFWIRPKTGFLTHNFGYRCANKSIKDSIDADFDLVFNKTLSQKNGSIGWGPRPAKDGQNFQNMSSLWHHLQKTYHWNRKKNKVFFDFEYKTC